MEAAAAERAALPGTVMPAWLAACRNKDSSQYLTADAMTSGRTALSEIVMSASKAVVIASLSMMTSKSPSRISTRIVAYTVIVQVLIAVTLLPAPGTGSADAARDRGGDRAALDSTASCAASYIISCACGKYCSCAKHRSYCSDNDSFHELSHKKRLPTYCLFSVSLSIRSRKAFPFRFLNFF